MLTNSNLAELLARDARDRSRAVAPLRQAEDATLLDTSDLDIEAAFAKALELTAVTHATLTALAIEGRLTSSEIVPS